MTKPNRPSPANAEDPPLSQRERVTQRRWVRAVFAFLIFTFAFITTAQAADIYVATTGNDTTGNGSAGNPYKTITKAFTVDTDGDTVHLAAGLYDKTGNGETFPLPMSTGVTLPGDAGQ